MSRFSLNFMNEPIRRVAYTQTKTFANYFDQNKIFYICSSGGCGSTIISNYLSNFGNVYHIHDRTPPNKLTYVGKLNTTEDVHSEWFNNVEIPEDKLKNYKVIFVYRHPIPVIFSRFAQRYGPNTKHLQNIKCTNNGEINIYDVLRTGRDLYGLEEFFDNYVSSKERNYPVHCVKYEQFWNNLSLFNAVMGIPDIKELYPIKHENPKRLQFAQQLNKIYASLINKMNKMRFIEIIAPIEKIEKEESKNE